MLRHLPSAQVIPSAGDDFFEHLVPKVVEHATTFQTDAWGCVTSGLTVVAHADGSHGNMR
jgi:hypothetical protein